MDTHDTAYRRLFSHPEMVRDLLLGFVPHPWVHELRMDTLEKVNGHYVTDDLRHRCGDVVWRVRWGREWIYLYVLLEFQSTVDPFMAVRIMAYTALLYQDLIRTKEVRPGRKLPPVLPVVLYNGRPRWKAATELNELIHPGPETLRAFLPRQRYLLLDEGAYPPHQLAALNNLVAALFRLENSRGPEEIQEVLVVLIDWLKTPEEAGLRRSLTAWLARLLRPHVDRGVDLPEWNDLQEVHDMLAERIQEWNRDLIERGRKEGQKEGRMEGESALLLRQLTHRFGPLPEDIRARLAKASTDELETWADRVLDAESLERVFL
jgi:predicted transposase YdaD